MFAEKLEQNTGYRGCVSNIFLVDPAPAPEIEEFFLLHRTTYLYCYCKFLQKPHTLTENIVHKSLMSRFKIFPIYQLPSTPYLISTGTYN
jgi:hypothetical protein